MGGRLLHNELTFALLLLGDSPDVCCLLNGVHWFLTHTLLERCCLVLTAPEATGKMCFSSFERCPPAAHPLPSLSSFPLHVLRMAPVLPMLPSPGPRACV